MKVKLNKIKCVERRCSACTCLRTTADRFETLGLNGGAARSKEPGALRLRPGFPPDRLQHDSVFTREEQLREAHKALLRHTTERQQ